MKKVIVSPEGERVKGFRVEFPPRGAAAIILAIAPPEG
jgi:hypothetical protein